MKNRKERIQMKIAFFTHSMGKLFILILLVIPFLCIQSCSTGINLNITKKKVDPLKTGSVREGVYVNNYYKCSFQVPTGWGYYFPEKEEEYHVHFFNFDKSNQIKFKIIYLGEKITLPEFVEKENALHKELTQIREEQIKIHGFTSIDTEYIQEVQAETLKLKKLYFIKGYHGFVFSLISNTAMFKEGSAKLYAMTDSFRFLSEEGKVEEVDDSDKTQSAEDEAAQKEMEEKKGEIPEDSAYIIHVVKKGQTLSSIAEYYTGDTLKHIQIAEFNGIKSPYKIDINDKIKIPKMLIKKTPPKKAPKADKKPKEEKEEKEEEPIYGPQ